MRWWTSRGVQVALSTAIVALVFGFLLPQLADYDDAWRSIADMTWAQVAVLTVVALWSLVSYLPLLLSVVPGMRMREAAISNLASTAVSNTLPGGGALGVGVTVTIQRSFGIPAADIARGAVVSGIWNNFAKLALPVVALALLAVTGHVGNGLTTAAIVGVLVLLVLVVLLAGLLRSERAAERAGAVAERLVAAPLRLLRREQPSGWSAGAAQFRRRTVGLVTGRAGRITTATLLSHLSLYLVLVVCVRSVGVAESTVGWVEILAAFAFVRLLSAIPLTPGGLGVVELGLTASLGNGLPQPVQDQIAAAVLLYRALTWFVPIPLGLVSWLAWRSIARRSRADASSRFERGEDGPVALGDQVGPADPGSLHIAEGVTEAPEHCR